MTPGRVAMKVIVAAMTPFHEHCAISVHKSVYQGGVISASKA
jgi:hypothetical protein